MKIIKITFLLLTVITCAILYSCKKDHSNTDSNVYNGSKVTFQKRWNISQTSARPSLINSHAYNYAHRPAALDTNYTAIEFMLDSTYIIFYSDGNLQVGQYLATNDTTLILDSLGTIIIKSLTANTFNFALIPDSSTSTIIFSTTAAAPIGTFSSPGDSAFVSSVWQYDSIVNITRGTSVPLPGDPETDIINSAYGTYILKYIYPDGTVSTYGLYTWLWTDDTHQSQCFGKWTGSPLTNCTGENIDTLVFSQQYTHLEFLQGNIDEYYHKK